jgi:hypothetical protein
LSRRSNRTVHNRASPQRTLPSPTVDNFKQLHRNITSKVQEDFSL